MKQKIFTLLLAVSASIGTMYAWTFQRVRIGDLYYNLEVTNQTAEVTSETGRTYGWSTDITTADIPASVTYNYLTYTVTGIGEFAFQNCSGLTSVTIPNTVKSIGEEAFSNCRSLTSVTIPNSVTSIGKYAFGSCTSLASVTIPDSVTHILAYTFTYCFGLTSVIIGKGVTDIAYYAFNDCDNITSVIWNAKNCNGRNFGSQVTSFIFGNEVEDIPSDICSGMTNLTSITIPNSVTSIGNSAFSGCTGLTSISVPNSVTSIGNYAFDNCTGLKSPVYNEHAFAYMPKSYSGAYAIPNGIEYIAGGAFYRCSSLTSVTIPNSVTRIGESAFRDCTGLTSIEIPNSVKWIDDYAFSGCTGFTSVTIPNNSEYVWIGDYAFDGCTGLTSVTCYNTQPPYVFSESFSSNPIIYVPEDVVFVYRTNANWGRYTIMPIEASSVQTDEVQVEPTETTVTVSWPTINGAATYELIIKDKSGNIICTLIFNANGQLTQIAFSAPAREQSAGFLFTVTGLKEGKSYDLTITAKNDSGATLDEKSISFTTAGTPTEDLNQIISDQLPTSQKVFRNGQIFILHGDRTYTLTGAEVK